MGQRLSMQLVVGVADFSDTDTDPRFQKTWDWDTYYEEKLCVTRKENHLLYGLLSSLDLDPSDYVLSDLLHIPTEDFGKPGLFGIVVGSISPNDVLYAIASLDDKFKEDDYQEVSKRTGDTYLRKYKPSKLTDEQGYVYLAWDFVVWLDIAKDTFDKIGFSVEKEDLRLYLEWHYA